MMLLFFSISERFFIFMKIDQEVSSAALSYGNILLGGIFLIWLFNKVGWFYNYSATGMITAPSRSVGSFFITGSESTPAAKYLFCFLFVFFLSDLSFGSCSQD